MNCLPIECLLEIFSKLDSFSLRQCALVSATWRDLARQNILWRSLCVLRWGPVVLKYQCKDSSPVNWFQYYRKRCCRAHWIQESPWGFIQEHYHKDPWKLLLCIILTSRTTTPMKHEVVKSFFSNWPTPSHVIDGSDEEMKAAVNILGLQDARVKYAKRCSEGFLLTDWEEAKDLKGVGTLGNDSWRLFCGWEEGPPWFSLSIDDCNVRRYQHWLVGQHRVSSVMDTHGGRPKKTKKAGQTQARNTPLAEKSPKSQIPTPGTVEKRTTRSCQLKSASSSSKRSTKSDIPDCSEDAELCRLLSRRPGLRPRAQNRAQSSVVNPMRARRVRHSLQPSHLQGSRNPRVKPQHVLGNDSTEGLVSRTVSSKLSSQKRKRPASLDRSEKRLCDQSAELCPSDGRKHGQSLRRSRRKLGVI